MTSLINAGSTPEVLWQPTAQRVRASRIQAFRDWLRTQRGLDLPDYRSLWQWSVTDLPGFWDAIAGFFDVRFHDQPRQVLAGEEMPGTAWFPGSSLNYAEHALREGEGKGDDDLAVVFAREDEHGEEITYGELRARVAAARAGLAELGVKRGDRVVALAPNNPQTVVAFLAAASLGAIWSSCSPDFGVRAIADRFVQVDPTVLIAVDGYRYNGRSFDIRDTVEQLRAELPGLRATAIVDYLGMGASLPSQPHPVVQWDDLLNRHRGAELGHEPVPFDHPLWVLYSSGTTGLPKGIVHGHGGMVLEHLKAIGLHCDLGPADRFFWFTTTGWMVWNFLVSGLMLGTTIVLFDGSPAHPGLGTLWKLAERHRVNYFGTSAPYVHSCLKAGLIPKDDYDLSALRTVGSTGAPLSTDGFRWVAEAIGPNVQIASVSGGTDLCTSIVGASPDMPVWAGEISCPMLGAAVDAYDDAGQPVHGEVGELVLTKPMPTMPLSFWNDPGGSRLRESYFDTFPGVWRHGDWVTKTARGSLIITGRSDSTLNRGGVRMGTAEFYRIVESFEGITDSLVIDTSGADESDGELLCFVVLAEGFELPDLEPAITTQLRTQLSPRHVPNRFIAIDEVPRTLNGKKLEVPVKKILSGANPDQSVSRGALRNPESLTPFVHEAARRRTRSTAGT